MNVSAPTLKFNILDRYQIRINDTCALKFLVLKFKGHTYRTVDSNAVIVISPLIRTKFYRTIYSESRH